MDCMARLDEDCTVRVYDATTEGLPTKAAEAADQRSDPQPAHTLTARVWNQTDVVFEHGVTPQVDAKPTYQGSVASSSEEGPTNLRRRRMKLQHIRGLLKFVGPPC